MSKCEDVGASEQRGPLSGSSDGFGDTVSPLVVVSVPPPFCGNECIGLGSVPPKATASEGFVIAFYK